MQSVAPAAAFHDTARLFIDNLHLAVNDHILVVLVEHAVSLQQLLQCVYALTLHGIVVEQLVLLVQTLLVGESGLVLQCRQLGSNVGQHEEVLVVYLISQPCCTLIGQVAGILFLVNHEVQGLHGLRHLAVVVLHIVLLSLQHAGLDTLFREILDEWLVLRQRLVRTEE